MILIMLCCSSVDVEVAVIAAAVVVSVAVVDCAYDGVLLLLALMPKLP